MAEVASAFVSLVPSARGFGSATERTIGGQLRGVGSRLGGVLSRGLKLGVVAGVGGVAAAFGAGLKGAAEYQKIQAQTAQVIKSTGGAARVSAKHVAKLGSTIEGYSAFGNEAVESGANLLLTFTGIRNEAGKGNKIFDRATKTITDMATALGTAPRDAAIQLGKALNDPVKGVTALQRVGVSFTQSQRDQIKAMVDAGDTMGAQKVILGELSKEFGGSAKAAGQTFAGSLSRLKNQFGDLLRDAVMPLLPALTRFVGFLAKRMPGAIGGAISTIKKLFKPFGRVASTIGDTAGSVKDFFTIGSGQTALKKALSFISDTAGTIKDAFGNAADSLARVRDTASEIDLGNIDAKKVGKALGTAVIEGLKFLGKSVGQVTKTLGDLFGKVDWVGIGITIGKQAPALLVGLAAGLLNFDFGSLIRGIGDHWFDILMGVIIIAFAPSKFIGPLAKILERIPFVGRFLAQAVRWLSDLGSKLTKFGGDLFRAFAEGFGKVKFPGAGLVSRVMGAFKLLPAKILDFWVTLQVRIGVWALDAFGAAGRGARTAVGRLLGYLGRLPGKIIAALGDVGSLLKSVGEDIVFGMKHGIEGAWHFLTDKIEALVKMLPGPVKKFLGIKSPSKVFAAIGRNVVQGLSVGVSDTAPVDAAMNRLLTSVSLATPPVVLSATAAGVGATSRGLGGGVVQNIYETTDPRATAAESARRLAWAGVA